MNEKTILRLPTFPTLGDLLAMLGIFLLVEVACSLLGVVVLLFSGQGPATLDPHTAGLYLAFVSFTSLAVTAGLLVWYRRWRRATPIQFGLRWRPFNPMLLLWSLLLMVAAGVLLEPLYALFPPLNQEVGRGVGALLALVIFAPVFEEFICRGLIYGSMRLRYSEWGAILLSALFFGVLHLHPTAVVNAFVMGVVLAFVYRVAGTLWAPIALHALNNLLAYVQLVTGFGAEGLWGMTAQHRWLYLIIYLLAAGVAIFAVTRLWKMPEKHAHIGKNTHIE